MPGMSQGSVRIVKLLLICAGTTAAQNERDHPTGSLRMDAGTNVQEPADRPLQAPPNVQLEGDIRSAPELFRLGRFAEAEPQFAWIAAVRRGTSWGERAQYHLAECQYQQKRYFAALLNFERLHTEYPATGYLDEVVRREYEIAQLWMTQLDPQTPVAEKLPWFAPGRPASSLRHAKNRPGSPRARQAK